MARRIPAILVVAFLSVLASAQDAPEPGKATRETQFDGLRAPAGSTLTCAQPPEVFHVPLVIAERAKIKARLINLLRESLFDDAKGIVNVAREKEIRKLADKLKHGY